MKRLSVSLLIAILAHCLALFLLLYSSTTKQKSELVGFDLVSTANKETSTSKLNSTSTMEPNKEGKPIAESSSSESGLSTTDAKPSGNFILVYPIISRELGEEGTVYLSFTIDKLGKARDIQVTKSSGHARLDLAALDAAKKASFEQSVNLKTLQVRFELK